MTGYKAKRACGTPSFVFNCRHGCHDDDDGGDDCDLDDDDDDCVDDDDDGDGDNNDGDEDWNGRSAMGSGLSLKRSVKK